METNIALEKISEVQNNVKNEVARCFRSWQVDTVDVGRFGATVYLSLKKYPKSNIQLIYHVKSEHCEESLKTNIAAMGSFDILNENETLAYYRNVGSLLRCSEILAEIKKLLSWATSDVNAIMEEYKGRRC